VLLEALKPGVAGIAESKIRTVSEDDQTLKFYQSGFEET
jgi:hypothetical protein